MTALKKVIGLIALVRMDGKCPQTLQEISASRVHPNFLQRLVSSLPLEIAYNYNTSRKLSYAMLLRQVSTQSVTAREALATHSAGNEKADVDANVAPERIPAIFLTTQSSV